MEHDNQPQTTPLEGDPPLVTLFRHNLWANLRLLDACAELDEQQMSAKLDGTYDGIYRTLKHILLGEQSYLRRITGHEPQDPLRVEHDPDLATLRHYARLSGEGLVAVAANTKPSDSVRVESDENRWTVPASLILTQALNHANEHRAQIMTIMTQQGVQPPSVSGWAYMEDTIPATPLDE